MYITGNNPKLLDVVVMTGDFYYDRSFIANYWLYLLLNFTDCFVTYFEERTKLKPLFLDDEIYDC
jgi:hypothetical protein